VVAGVVGARVAIVADNGRALACAAGAHVVFGAGVAVVAGVGVVGEDALACLAGVARAWIVVVADDRRMHTHARAIARVDRACVAVIAIDGGECQYLAGGPAVVGVV